MSDVSAADRAREAARNCEAGGLLAEADILYRLAVSLELEERAGASASLSLSNTVRLYMNYDGKFRATNQSHLRTLGVELKF